MNNLSKIERLTSQFYLWELRGRGWKMWDSVVDIEPPFVPFIRIPESENDYIDDGRKHTVISAFLERLFKNNETKEETVDYTSIYLKALEESEPDIFNSQDHIREIGIKLPYSNKYDINPIEQLLISSSVCNYPLAFEILANSESISIQFSCFEPDYEQLINHLMIYFPNINITENDGLLNKIGINEDNNLIVEFGLSEEFIRPLISLQKSEIDPLVNIMSILNNLASHEVVVFQVLFKSVRNSWAENVVASTKNYDGSCFFMDAPEMLSLAIEKTQKPLFSVVLRLAVSSRSKQKTLGKIKQLNRCFELFNRPQSNELIPLSNNYYDDKPHLQDLFLRQSHRSGMILNSDELRGFVHFPMNVFNLSKLKSNKRRTRKSPNITLNNKFILGVNLHNDKEQKVTLNHEQRFRHTYVVGATGTGKSTLLQNLIIQDVIENLGVCVVDPHGELIENVLKYIPESRYDDVVLFDPSDTDYPIGLNILEAKTDIERNVLSSDLVSIFKRFSSSWGDQMTAILGNAISAILENRNGGTLLDLRKFLADKEFRRKFLENVHDEIVKSFWENEYHLIKGGALSSILTRLDTFLRPKIIRNIITQRKGIDLDYVINNNKILLVKLAQGLIGDENANLLGSLFISKLQQAIMKRQSLQKSERNPFYLYLDEFQNFTSPSMNAILSGARKYNFGLVLAHQELRQLWDKDTSLANSVMSNPYTRICFRLGDFDANKFQYGFTNFEAIDLQNLGIGEAIARVERAEYDFNLKTYLPLEVDEDIALKKKEIIIDLSRKKYGNVSDSKERVSYKEPVVSKPTIKTEYEDTSTRADEISKKTKVKKTSHDSDDKKNISYHRYLQTLIKKMAEQSGYKAVIEQPTEDGKGRVDVGLERNNEKIAIEISVTTNKEQELHNIKKCLFSGYEIVVVCSNEKKHLNSIKKLIEEEIDSSNHNKILYFQPEQLFSYLQNQVIDKKEIKEKIVKGYRVKVEYNDISEDEKFQKEKVVAGVLLKAMRRLKK